MTTRPTTHGRHAGTPAAPRGRRSAFVALTVVLLSFFSISVRASVGLELSFVRSEFVLREPLKCRVVFTNPGDETARIFPIANLGGDQMENMFFEVVTPSGEVQKRRHQIAIIDRRTAGAG
jgi:hypothetical protein